MTKEEILQIEKDAEHHYSKIWKATRYFQFWNKKPTDVIFVTPVNELILIQGNDEVGFEHIRKRHFFWSTNIHRKNNNTSFDNPSKLNGGIIYQDVPQICDLVYSKENLVPEKNNNPELNDVYEGLVDGQSYRLILYTGTKIIVSLIPLETHSKKTKLRNFKFTRGIVTIETGSSNLSRLILIPYLDINLQVKYVVRITKTITSNRERWEIMVMDEPTTSNIQFLITETKLRWVKSEKTEQLHFQHDELRQLEIEIKKLDMAITNGEVDIQKLIAEGNNNNKGDNGNSD